VSTNAADHLAARHCTISTFTILEAGHPHKSAGKLFARETMNSATTLLCLLCICATLLPSLAFGPSATLGRVELEGIRIENFGDVPSVLVRVKLSAGDQSLVVPCCGVTKAGEKLLCLDSAHLQYRIAGQWRPVLLRRSFGILGAKPAPFATTTVAAHESSSLVFLFSRRFFVVHPSQRLRLIVDTWPDQDSARQSRAAIKLEIPAFRCPAIGIFRQQH